MINRRSLITGLVSFIAAPAIVRAGSLMPVKAYVVNSAFIDDDVAWAVKPWLKYFADFKENTGQFYDYS